jgi:cell division protease FtsH
VYAEATQAAINREVSKLLRQGEGAGARGRTAEDTHHRPEPDALVDLLLERETVDGSDLYRLADRRDRSAIASAPTMTAAPKVSVP